MNFPPSADEIDRSDDMIREALSTRVNDKGATLPLRLQCRNVFAAAVDSDMELIVDYVARTGDGTVVPIYTASPLSGPNCAYPSLSPTAAILNAMLELSGVLLNEDTFIASIKKTSAASKRLWSLLTDLATTAPVLDPYALTDGVMGVKSEFEGMLVPLLHLVRCESFRHRRSGIDLLKDESEIDDVCRNLFGSIDFEAVGAASFLTWFDRRYRPAPQSVGVLRQLIEMAEGIDIFELSKPGAWPTQLPFRGRTSVMAVEWAQTPLEWVRSLMLRRACKRASVLG